MVPEPKHQNTARNRVVLWFFCIGTLVPVILLLVGLALSTTDQLASGATPRDNSWIFPWWVIWLIWPTWIVLFDAEHWYQIIPTMLIAAPLNGVWYGIMAFAVWYLGRGLRWLVAAMGR
ncbi:MAG: hypothetical protein DMG31_11490 [Acidobacteria bacterium]|nr:MAG: hypothetical protein DMG31_11490 [Acidobacteriota bacterium]